MNEETWFRDFGTLKTALVTPLEFGKDELNVMARVLMKISMGSTVTKLTT